MEDVWRMNGESHNGESSTRITRFADTRTIIVCYYLLVPHEQGRWP